MSYSATKQTFKTSSSNHDITSIEPFENNGLFFCNEANLFYYDLKTNTQQCLNNGAEGVKGIEFNCLTYSKQLNLLFVSNEANLHLFNVNNNGQTKHLNKFKFCKETINAIEIQNGHYIPLIGLCDDSGEIKLCDLRQNNEKQEASLTLRKKLTAHHPDICSTIKFNSSNHYELFSGSFDCTLIRWDMRQPKVYLNKINISDLNKIENEKNQTMTCSMTPCFVHTIYLSEFNSKTILLAGIENGLCFAFDATNLTLNDSEQMQSPFNCALTQLNSLNLLNDSNSLMVACGNGKSIELFNLNEKNNEIKINKLNQFKIDHNAKINSAKCQNNKLFLTDTTDYLTIYDFNKQ